MANKRQIFAGRMKPRWAPTSNMGEQFEDFKSDPNNLFKKQLEPLNKVPLQQEAFKRSTVQGIQFKAETASIIWKLPATFSDLINASSTKVQAVVYLLSDCDCNAHSGSITLNFKLQTRIKTTQTKWLDFIYECLASASFNKNYSKSVYLKCKMRMYVYQSMCCVVCLPVCQSVTTCHDSASFVWLGRGSSQSRTWLGPRHPPKTSAFGLNKFPRKLQNHFDLGAWMTSCLALCLCFWWLSPSKSYLYWATLWSWHLEAG